MPLFQNIRTVAKYEAKILRRSWFFRLFSVGSLFIMTLMNIGMFSPVGDEGWDLVAFPASIPFFNLYLLNIGQAIVVIFLAADFLKRDKKVDTNEVLYTRSMSNFEYISGKTWGILKLFLGLDIVILSIGLLMNIISKKISLDISSYIVYLLIISVPTIIFSLGLAFMMMSVIRNQAITFLLLLGIAALNIFWLYYRIGSIFDYMAFGLPMLKSTMIGFDDIGRILNQRLLFFFSGLSLVLATVLLFKRLPQSKSHTFFSALFMIIFLGAALVAGFNTFSYYKKDLDQKQLVIESNRKFENSNFVSLTEARIEFNHKQTTFEASSNLVFINRNSRPVDKYIFSLNPDLVVNKVSSGKNELKFTRSNQIIEIEPFSALLPDKQDTINIFYSGSIDESFCYPDYTDNIKLTPYRISNLLSASKRQAFLTSEYVLLTPESHWYPVPSLNYYPTNPARIKIDFAKFTLLVKQEEGLTPVSQGKMKIENGYAVFYPESPLSGITLAIGKYLSDTLQVDSVKYISYYYPGHDYYKKDLSQIKDTLSLLVSGIMRDLETTFSTKYPFRTLGLLEVPVQFYSFPRMSTQTRAELQPSLVLLPEKLSILENAGFEKRFTRQKRRMARNNQVITDKELQVRLFNDFVRNTFISGENFRFINGQPRNEPVRYRLGPSFYFFKNNFYSDEYPVINSVFESHLQKQEAPQGGFMAMTGGLSETDRANLILRNASFRDILARNPEGDTIRAVLTVKGDYLFNFFRSKAGINEFKDWFQDYIDVHKFQSVDILTLNNDMSKKFGFEFYPYLNDWFNKKEQPGFIFTNTQANEIIVGDRVRYLVTFVASNPEQVAGIFNVSFRTGGPGAGKSQGGEMIGMYQGPSGGSFTISMQGRGMEPADISKIVVLGAGEAKKINIILDAQPREMMINSLFAKNIPGEISIPFEDIKKTKVAEDNKEGEQVLPEIPRLSFKGETIVDNEDTGFSGGTKNVISPLKKLLGIRGNSGSEYEQINMFWAPERWQPVVKSSYYGKYIRSAVYARSSKDMKNVTWNAQIDAPGFYDVYCYIGKSGDRMSIRKGSANSPSESQLQSGDQGENIFKDMHYRIFHDEGVDEISVDFDNAEPGWNMLGRYYLSRDSAKVELTNQSSGRMVIGDAVKWVKVN